MGGGASVSVVSRRGWGWGGGASVSVVSRRGWGWGCVVLQ